MTNIIGAVELTHSSLNKIDNYIFGAIFDIFADKQ